MVDEKSFIDMAYTLLNDKGATMNLYDIIDEFKDLVVMNLKRLKIENQWGLRDWYSVDDIEEKSHLQFILFTS